MAIQISSMDHHHNPQEAEEPVHLESASLTKKEPTIPKKKPNRWYISLRNRLFRTSASGSGSGTSNINSNAGSKHNYSSCKPCQFFAVSNVSVCIVGTILICLSTHRVVSLIMTHRRWINAPSTYEHRVCPRMDYATLSESTHSSPSFLSSTLASTAKAENADQRAMETAGTGLKICMTTLTDQKSPSRFQRFIRWRNFDGILDLTWPNKLKYATKHGYHLVDGSKHIDTTRPPAWSKIHAVRHLLEHGEGDESSPCDWVMWTDADTVVMNSDIRIQDFLPSDTTKDLLVGSDKGGGYNSGVFLFRNSPWSKQFLEDWWNMKDFVRPPGFSLSGDNAALKAFLQTMHDRGDFAKHVLVPPRCTFNSFAKFLTVGQSLQVKDHWTESLSSSVTDEEHYYKGDFIAHIPGVDNKVECLKLLLAETR